MIPPKYYPHVLSSEELDLNALADLISDGSMVRRNDVYAVLIGLVDTSIKKLKAGHKLRFGELGLFYFSVKGSSVDDPAELHAGQVKSCRVCYLAGTGIREELKRCTLSLFFDRVSGFNRVFRKRREIKRYK